MDPEEAYALIDGLQSTFGSRLEMLSRHRDHYVILHSRLTPLRGIPTREYICHRAKVTTKNPEVGDIVHEWDFFWGHYMMTSKEKAVQAFIDRIGHAG